MFKDDRFMTLATGLVLAIVVGTMAQKSDLIMSFFGAESAKSTTEDSFTVRAGRDQTLDVQANDTLKGELVIVDLPSCGELTSTSGSQFNFTQSEACLGKVEFSYCVEDEEGECAPSLVALTVVNDALESQIAANEAAETADRREIDPNLGFVSDSPVPVASNTNNTGVNTINTGTVTEEPQEPETVATNTTDATDDRFTPNQIVLQDDSTDVEVVGFGAGRAPTLFAPSMEELVQPQDTVDILRRSVAAIAPVDSNVDQGLSTQESAAQPRQTNLSAGDLSGNDIVLGTEPAPQIAFAAPEQPRLGPAPGMLQPSQPSVEDTTLVIEYGPEVPSETPDNIEIAEGSTDPEPVDVPNEIDNLVADLDPDAEELFGQNPVPAPENVDTQTADAGDVSVDSGDPSDSSDIVVEMAAQILLPGPQINDSIERGDQSIPVAEGVLSDSTFIPETQDSLPSNRDEVDLAALTPATDPTSPSVGTTDSANSCPIDVNASARPGASISMFVSSPCRPEQVVTVEHAGLVFTAITDARGTYSTSIPAFESNAVINVSFDDGGSTQSRVLVRDATDIERIALVWSAPIEMDMHAFEAGASENSVGHVWVGNPRRYRDTLTGGGGYLETFGDVRILGGTFAEVYSLPTNRMRAESVVRMDLRISDASGNCGEAVILRTVRNQDDGTAQKREFNLQLPNCDSGNLAGLVLENFVDPIRVANR